MTYEEMQVLAGKLAQEIERGSLSTVNLLPFEPGEAPMIVTEVDGIDVALVVELI